MRAITRLYVHLPAIVMWTSLLACRDEAKHGAPAAPSEAERASPAASSRPASEAPRPEPAPRPVQEDDSKSPLDFPVAMPAARSVTLSHRVSNEDGTEAYTLNYEAEAGADDEGVRRFELLPDELVWIALGSLRLRVRLVPREAMVTSPQLLDRPWLASLLSCAVVAMAVLALLRAQPAPAAYELERDDDERRAAVARLLPEPPLDSEEDEPVEESTPDARHGTERTPRPSRRPEPRPSTSTRPRQETPRWVPANAAAAVGHMGRNYDPMAAARQAGILGIIGDRRLTGDTVFDQAIDDHQLWAATSSEPTMPDWLLGGPSIDTRRPGDQLVGLRHDLIGYGSYGDLSISARSAGFASRGGFDPRWKKQWQPPPKLGLHVT
ncbi:MAG: hypothetical protein KC457_21240, partial [Myxococcales bacterium]|nr:hypothetical protein [Myxococcales bacterium]